MLYRFKGFDLDDEIFALRRAGADVPLRPQALDVLLYLVRHPERVVTRRELYDAVWRGTAVSDSTLPQAILAIRRALDDDGADPGVIQTARGRGYRFAAEIEIADAERGVVRTTGSLVGRDEPLRRLDELIQASSAGRSRIAMVTGEAGIGRTRILEEASRRARTTGARVLEARCHVGEGTPELWVWVQVLRAYVDGPPGPVAREASELAQKLAAEAGASSSEPNERFVAFDRIVQVIRRAAQNEPIVILVDDLHSADPASLLLLKLLVSSLGTARVAVVASYRDSAVAKNPILSRTLGALAREDPTCRIQLEPLSREEIARLATAALGVAKSGTGIDEALVDRLLEKTDGNPLLLTHMLEALVRAARSDGSTSALLEVGEMREAIALHLEELSEETLGVLVGASVLGTELALSRLAPTLGIAPAKLLEHLDEALRVKVLGRTTGGGYRFMHVLVRDVLYRKLSLAERARLHEAAGVAALDEHADEDAVCHLERALRGLDLLASVPETAETDDARVRAETLLAVLRRRPKQSR